MAKGNWKVQSWILLVSLVLGIALSACGPRRTINQGSTPTIEPTAAPATLAPAGQATSTSPATPTQVGQATLTSPATVAPGATPSVVAPSSGAAATAAPLGQPQTTGAIIGAMFPTQQFPNYCSQASAAGVAALTLTIPWRGIEPQKGSFRFQQYDALIQQIRACGLTIGAHVLSNAPWAIETPPPPSQQGRGPRTIPSMPPKNFQDYYDFMYALASHYKGQISRYSIENEAHSAKNWGSTPEAYAQLLATAYKAVHAADPNAIVLNDGMVSGMVALLTAYDKVQAGQAQAGVTFIQQFGSSGQTFQSGQDIQNYINTSPEGQSGLKWIQMLAANQSAYDHLQIHYYGPPELLPEVLGYMHQQLQAQGGDKPVEVWELGYRHTDPTTLDLTKQAQEVAQLVSTAVGEGSLFTIYWRFTNDVEQNTGVTGLVTETGARPALTAYKEIATKLAGAMNPQRLNLGAGVMGYQVERGGQSVYVVWRTDGGSGAVMLPANAASVNVTDINGQMTTADAKAVSVTASPVVVETP